MPTPIQYPLINGVRHSFASIELKMGAQIFTGFKSINYSRKRNRALVRGNSPDPIAKTKGDNEYAGDCELYLAEWNLFQSQANSGLAVTVGPVTVGIGGAGGGYGDQFFKVTVSYNENGFDLVQDVLLGCSIDSTEASQSQSPDPLVRKIDLSPLKILFNGIEDLATPLVAPISF